MKANYSNQKEEDVTSNENFEKSELMQLFEFEVKNPYRAQLDLINAILEEE